MRDVHHFGQRTHEEIYNALRDGGQNIHDATKNAGKEFADQAKASTDMRKMESKALNSSNKKDRAMDRAARLEAYGQDGAANALRRRTDAKFAKEMQEILPADKGAKDELQVGADAIDEAVNQGGGGGGGGHDPVLSAINNIEKFLSDTFFKDFKERLPQNAMS
jgi:glucose-6-phosphate isomerase